MSTKLITIEDLVNAIYVDNVDHFDNSENSCDCYIHQTIQTIVTYWDE